jgi:excisionase family DNA binding protein
MLVNSRAHALQAEGLTLAEASIISGIGRTKLYQAIAEGQLVARKFGSRTIILRDDLLQFLASLPEAK